MGSFKQVQEILPLHLEKEIIGDEESCCIKHTCRRIPHFLTRCMVNSLLKTKTWPNIINVRPIFTWRRKISPYLLKRYKSLLFSSVPMEQFAIQLTVDAWSLKDFHILAVIRTIRTDVRTEHHQQWGQLLDPHRTRAQSYTVAPQDLDTTLLRTYANAIFDKSAALNNCFGFIDWTVRPICRPVVNQRTVYNGHKQVLSL